MNSILTNAEKNFISDFCRVYLFDCVDKTSFSPNIELKAFILKELSYEQLIRMTFTRDFRYVTEDSESDRKLDSIEQGIKPFARLGIAIMVGGPLYKQLGSKLATGGILSGGQAAIAGTIGGSMALGWGVSLLSKFLFVIIKKMMDKCRKECTTSIDDNVDNAKIKRRMCGNQCRGKSIMQMISKLRSEIPKCSQTQNPEKCQAGILKKIGQYNEMMEKEKKGFESHSAQLRMSYQRRSGIAAPEPTRTEL